MRRVNRFQRSMGGSHREMSGARLAKMSTPIFDPTHSDRESLADPAEKRRRAMRRAGDLISKNAAKRKPFLS